MLDRTKTQEEMTKLREIAETSAREYNELFQSGNFTGASSKLTAITEAVNKYTANAKALAFDKLFDCPDPLAEACRQYTFETISAVDEKIEGTIIKKKVINDTERPMALEDMQKYAKSIGKSIGNDKKWMDAIHKLNYLMAVRLAEKLGIDPSEIRDCYRIKDVAKEYQLGIAHAEDGDTQTLAAIKKIISMMISSETYDEPDDCDVTFINRVWSKKGKKCGQVAVANHRQMVDIMMQIAHRCLTGEMYSIDYKRAKGK